MRHLDKLVFIGAATIAGMVMLLQVARADTLSLGYWDDTQFNGVTLLGSTGASQQIQVLGPRLGSGFGFAQILTRLTDTTANGVPTKIFETEFDDGFVPPQGGNFFILGSWQGSTSAGTKITLPTQSQVSEMVASANGFTVTESLFLCSPSVLFCDNYRLGGGTLLGSTMFVDSLGNNQAILTGLVPGQAFTLTEVLEFSRSTFGSPQGDVGAAIFTTPISNPIAVPGPIIGAGLPGLFGLILLGLARLCLLEIQKARRKLLS